MSKKNNLNNEKTLENIDLDNEQECFEDPINILSKKINNLYLICFILFFISCSFSFYISLEHQHKKSPPNIVQKEKNKTNISNANQEIKKSNKTNINNANQEIKKSNTNKESTPLKLITDSNEDFSGEQGENNWYYGYYKNNINKKSFEPLLYSVKTKMSGTFIYAWSNKATGLECGNSWNPGLMVPYHKNNLKLFPAKIWESKEIESINCDIEISASLEEKSEDGVIIGIMLNNTIIYHSPIISLNSKTTLQHKIENIRIDKEDKIIMLVNPLNNSKNDAIDFRIKIYKIN